MAANGPTPAKRRKRVSSVVRKVNVSKIEFTKAAVTPKSKRFLP
jgi:hypothetical protein